MDKNNLPKHPTNIARLYVGYHSGGKIFFIGNYGSASSAGPFLQATFCYPVSQLQPWPRPPGHRPDPLSLAAESKKASEQRSCQGAIKSIVLHNRQVMKEKPGSETAAGLT